MSEENEPEVHEAPDEQVSTSSRVALIESKEDGSMIIELNFQNCHTDENE